MAAIEIKYGKRAQEMLNESERESKAFDYVIIGGGTAGCLLANRLSAVEGEYVALLEAGGQDNYHWIHIPVGYLYCIGNPRTDWLYKTQPSDGLNGRSLNYPRGKVLGGCSSINGMIYMRGQSQDYDAWAQAGNCNWTWAECLPYFKQHENYHGGASEFHGGKGEWHVNQQRLHWPLLDSFKAAAIEAGLPYKPDFNQGNNEGVGYFEVNQFKGFRWNTAKAFISPVFGRQNLLPYIHSPVKRLTFDGTRCTGAVVHNADGTERHYIARREVILAAGAINSPALLERSGIGQAARLQALGIALVKDVAGVGENLQDHLQIRTVFKVKNARTLNTLAASWWGKLKMGAQYALRRSGPMSMAPSQLGAFAKSHPRHARANVEFHVQPLSLDAFGQPLHPFDAMTVSVCNLRPTSRGSVHIASSDPHEAPLIQPNYLATAEDRQVAAESILLARSIMQQAAMQKHLPEEYKPGLDVQTEDELIRAAGHIASTIFHPVGTCKMGPESDTNAVVNDRFQVHGIRNLRVVDASVMPLITSGNTNSPVLMMAERAAAWILEDLAQLGEAPVPTQSTPN